MEKKRSKDLPDAPAQKAEDTLSLDAVVEEIKAIREAIPLPEGPSVDFLPTQSPDAGISELCRLQLIELLGELQEIKRQYDEAKSQLKKIHETKAEVGGLQTRISEAEAEKRELESRWAEATTTKTMNRRLEKVQKTESAIGKMRDELEKKTALIRGEEEVEEVMEKCIRQTQDVLLSTRAQVMNLLKPKTIISETSEPRPEPATMPRRESKSARRRREREVRRQGGQGPKQAKVPVQHHEKKKKGKKWKHNFPKEQTAKPSSGKEYTVRAPSFMTQANVGKEQRAKYPKPEQTNAPQGMTYTGHTTAARYLANFISKSLEPGKAQCLSILHLPASEPDRSEFLNLCSKMDVWQLDYSPLSIKVYSSEPLQKTRRFFSEARVRASMTLQQFRAIADAIEILSAESRGKRRPAEAPLGDMLLLEAGVECAAKAWIENIKTFCWVNEPQIYALRHIIEEYEKRIGMTDEKDMLARAAFSLGIIAYSLRAEELYRELDAAAEAQQKKAAEVVSGTKGGITGNPANDDYERKNAALNEFHRKNPQIMAPDIIPVSVIGAPNVVGAYLQQMGNRTSTPGTEARPAPSDVAPVPAAPVAITQNIAVFRVSEPVKVPASTSAKIQTLPVPGSDGQAQVHLKSPSATTAFHALPKSFSANVSNVSGPVMAQASTSAPVHVPMASQERNLPSQPLQVQPTVSTPENEIDEMCGKMVEDFCREMNMDRSALANNQPLSVTALHIDPKDIASLWEKAKRLEEGEKMKTHRMNQFTNSRIQWLKKTPGPYSSAEHMRLISALYKELFAGLFDEYLKVKHNLTEGYARHIHWNNRYLNAVYSIVENILESMHSENEWERIKAGHLAHMALSDIRMLQAIETKSTGYANLDEGFHELK